MTPAPVEDVPVPEDRDDLDDLDWDALLPDEPTADADDSQRTPTFGGLAVERASGWHRVEHRYA